MLRGPIALAGVLITMLTGCAGPTAGSSTGTAPTRVMPLGDSITWGEKSTDGSGYRGQLGRRLAAAGQRVDFVGSVRTGTGRDPDNEGHRGWRIDHLSGSVDGWLAAADPEVVLLNAGTNDMVYNDDPAHAPERLGRLVDRIRRDVPAARILVSTLIPNGDPAINRRVTAFNAALPRVAEERHVELVDLHRAITTPGDLDPDGTHPLDSGYAKMGTLWFEALRRPRPVPGH